MRALVQRVSSGRVEVEGKETAAIGPGLVVLLGVRRGDGPSEARYLAEKCARLRVFDDAAGKMNRSLLDTGGAVLAVSQFTLYGDARQGNRPGFTDAAPPAEAEPLYDEFVAALRGHLGADRVRCGVFGTAMKVTIINEGPVTILLEREPERRDNE